MGQSTNDMMAVNLPHEPREYMCTWHLPKAVQDSDEDQLVDVPGTIDLTGRHDPTASFQGILPYVSDSGRASFPQTNNFNCLTGTLSSGIHVALLNGQTSYWLHNGGGAKGAFAVLSTRPFEHDNYRKYQSVELQIDGLETIVDEAPTTIEFTKRTDEHDESYKISIPTQNSLDWKIQEAQMRLGYARRLRPDRFNFRTSFTPHLRIDLDEPISLVDWWLQWVVPLCDILEVINGKPLDIMYLLAFEDKDATGSQRRADQVFRYDILQDCIKIDDNKFNHIKPVINLQEDGVNLLELINKHCELKTSKHPLIETYNVNALSDDQHPRSRYLLLIQALEGLYGYEHKEEYQQRCEKYTEKRNTILEKVKPAVSKEDFRFLKKNFPRKPISGLRDALNSTFQGLPKSVQDQIDGSEIVAQFLNKPGSKRMSAADALANVRNKLSHGSSLSDPNDLEEICSLLDKIVRAEIFRVLELPDVVRQRMIES
ncbi:HEPN domain-containing protein [Actinomyces naeslundii]|uniref:ApeA N-terminal domain 1-containing protein n=1 Tax=Actinomyces naeslundii TaxID=1655 RepID=UPI0028EB4684|nr:HEPN domain-containing protein [Actinomyces naeslundii]